MPSPFPGMDPYLESWIWRDFHVNLMCAVRAQLNATLPRQYVGRLHVGPEDPSEQRLIRIVNLPEKRIVTVIGVPSPPNKSLGEPAEMGRFGGNEYVPDRVNVVEFDLLRSRVRPSLSQSVLPMADYYVLVRRASEASRLLVWPFSVRDHLPQMSIPLDAGQQDVMLDLRLALDHVYDQGRYDEQLDYTKPPTPPFREADASWARDLLASQTNNHAPEGNQP